MAKWLSKEWVDQVMILSQTQPERAGVNLRLQFRITGAPSGDVTYFWHIVDGQLAGCDLGEIEGSEVTLVEHYVDAYEIQMGNLDMTDAFMQGKVTVEGDITKLLSLLPITNSEEFQLFQQEVAKITEPIEF